MAGFADSILSRGKQLKISLETAFSRSCRRQMIAENVICGSERTTSLGAMRQQCCFCQRLVGAREMKVAIFKTPSFSNMFVLATWQVSWPVTAKENFRC